MPSYIRGAALDFSSNQGNLPVCNDLLETRIQVGHCQTQFSAPSNRTQFQKRNAKIGADALSICSLHMLSISHLIRDGARTARF